MRALIQRVLSASVTVDGAITGEIGPGVLVLICAMQEDTEQKSSWLAQKIAKLRIFQDDDGRMNRSLLDIGGSALVISQFTLAADTKGNRPGFSRAAPPERGHALYTHFSEALAATGAPIANGIFGSDMKVALVNDGPVTIWLDTDNS